MKPSSGVLVPAGWPAGEGRSLAGLGARDTLLVHAAAGGVGSFAVQLAVQRGATVIGTASERNHGYLRQLGAVPVRYGDGLVDRVHALASEGVDAALDAIGGEALDVSVQLVPDRDRAVTIADWAGAQRLGIRRIGTDRSRAKLRDLTSLYEADKLHVEVAGTFAVADAAEAHREVETGHVRGKVVLLA